MHEDFLTFWRKARAEPEYLQAVQDLIAPATLAWRTRGKVGQGDLRRAAQVEMQPHLDKIAQLEHNIGLRYFVHLCSQATPEQLAQALNLAHGSHTLPETR